MPRLPRLRRDESSEPPPQTPDSQEIASQPTTDAEAPTTQLPAVDGTAPVVTANAPSFAERTRMRRRLRYLRRLRELAFRDLGGLTFDLHRFGRDRRDLVAAKLDALTAIDRELRALETGLNDRRALHELHEPGIAACPRCATLHGSDANFCPGCGTPLRGTVVREAAAVSITPIEQPQQPTQPTQATQPTQPTVTQPQPQPEQPTEQLQAQQPETQPGAPAS
jgi:hypothetical protein